MATYIQQSDLVVDTIRDMIDLRESSYGRMRRDLERLADQTAALPFTVVTTNIGAAANVDWVGAALQAPAAPSEPSLGAGLPTAVLVPAVAGGGAISVEAKPQWSDPDPAPDDLGNSALPAVPAVGALPDVTAAVPTMDVAILDEDFVFEEPATRERVSAEVEAQIKRVLGGDLGLPADYWDSLWQQTAGDLAEAAQAQLRTARNRGAATHWGLPGETVLAASRRILDEQLKAAQLARLEQAKQAAVFAREDFWQAIGQALAYESQWIGANQQVAARALAAAEQLHGLRVQVHNANVSRFNLLLERSRLATGIDEAKLRRALERHRAELAGDAQELQRAAHEVQRYQARYQGYQISSGARVSNLAERVRYWNGQTEAHARLEALKQAKSKLDVDNWLAQVGKVQTLAQATAQLLAARTGVTQVQLAGETGRVDALLKRNALEVDLARLIQQAQEVKAKLDVAQSQWLNGQALNLQGKLADLSTGYAQATLAASDVALGSSVGISLSGRA